MMNPYLLQILARLRSPQQSTAMDMPSYDWLNDSNRIPGRLGDATALDAASLDPMPPPPVESEVQDFDMEAARRDARRQGLGALGIALLRGAPTGDFSGSLAEGLAGMAETRHRLMQEAEQRARLMRQERRQETEAERQARESEERILSERQQREQQAGTFAHTQGEWSQKDEERAAKAARAQELAKQINALAPNSVEAQKAAALATGEHADLFLDDLEKIHSDAVTRSRRQEDFDWATHAGIGRSKAEIEAGVANDPRADDARANRSLAIQEGYLRERQAGGGTKTRVTPAQYNDDVRQEAQKLHEEWLKQRSVGVGQLAPWTLDPANKKRLEAWKKANPGRIPFKVAPTPAEIDAARRAAEEEAKRRISVRYEQAGFEFGSQGGDYYFDSMGNPIQP